MVVDVVTELARESVQSKLLYADDLVQISVTIEGLMNTFIEWNEAFECKYLKVILRIMKIKMNGSIMKDGLSKSNADPCMVCQHEGKG